MKAGVTSDRQQPSWRLSAPDVEMAVRLKLRDTIAREVRARIEKGDLDTMRIAQLERARHAFVAMLATATGSDLRALMLWHVNRIVVHQDRLEKLVDFSMLDEALDHCSAPH